MASELIFFLHTCVELLPEEAPANFKAKFPVLQELFAKSTVGIKMTSH